MTSTRDPGRAQALKITLREALGGAKRRRGEGKPHHAEDELGRAAQARETLIADYLTPGLERELADPATGDARRHALAAHLLNSEKEKTRRAQAKPQKPLRKAAKAFLRLRLGNPSA